MKLETWVSLASLGLSAMFAALFISLSIFLIGPEGKGPEHVVDPGALLIQEVAISAVPSVVLSGFVFLLTRTVGNKPAGLILVGTGVIMVAGMVYSTTLLPRIPAQYAVGGIPMVPYLFMAAGVGVIGIGGYLAAVAKRAKTAHNLDDLR